MQAVKRRPLHWGAGGAQGAQQTQRPMASRALRRRLVLLLCLLALLPRCAHAPHESIGPQATPPEWEDWAAPDPHRRPRQGSVVFESHGCERMRCSGAGCQDGVVIDACWTETIVGCAELVQESVTCEYLSRCGPDMWYPAPCVETEIERWVASSSPAPPPADADNSCSWTRSNGQLVPMGNDGSCDEPNYCTVGTDCADCGTCSAAGARPGANTSVWVLRPPDSAPLSQCGSQTAALPPIQARCHKTEHRCNLCAVCNDGLYPSANRKACLANFTNNEEEEHEAKTDRVVITLIVLGVLGLLAFVIVQPIIWKVLKIMWKHLCLCKTATVAVWRQKVYGESPPEPKSAKVQPAGAGAMITITDSKGRQLAVTPAAGEAGTAAAKRRALALANGSAKRNRKEALLDKEIQDAAEAVRAETIRKGGSPAAAKSAYEACLARLKEQKRLEAVARNERAMRRLQRTSPSRLPRGGGLQPLPQLRNGALPSMILSPGHFSPARKSSAAARYDGLSP